MELIMENQEYENYKKAQKKVSDIKGFYGHLITYVLVNAVLIFINLRYSPQYLWFLWPMLSWGVGLLINGIIVFDAIPFLNKNWEERKIKQFIEEEKSKQNKYE